MADNIEILYIKTLQEIEGIRPIWEQLQAKEAYPKVYADIDRYLSVIEADEGRTQPHILLVKQNDIVVSMLIGCIGDSRIKCNLGRTTLFQPTVRRLSVVYGGVLGNPEGDILDLLIDQLMNALRSREVDVVFFDHLEIDSPLYRYARSKPNVFCRSYFPKVESHWIMSVPQSIDEFLRSCSKKRRTNLLRYVRRCENQFPGQVKMVSYSREDEVESAVKTVSEISSLTYQSAFGGGINNDDRTRKLFRAAAKKGWLRVYVLLIKDLPCAFRYRLKYRETYFAEITGYLPEWKDFDVGHVLFYKVMEEMCNDPTVCRLDFGFGDGYHKRWGKKNSRQEASLYIFAPRFFPVFVNLVQTSTRVIGILIQHIVTKLGMFYLVQRFRRRRVMQKRSNSKKVGL